MKLLLQNNLLRESWLKKVEILAQKYPSQLVSANVLDHIFESSEPIIGIDYIPYGSVNLMQYAMLNGFKGVAFNPDTFSYSKYAENTKTLNKGQVMSMVEGIKFFEENEGLWFCKPNAEGKLFTGSVQHSEFYKRFFENMLRPRASNHFVDLSDTSIFISEPKEIQMEVRWFVVGGKVLEGTMYRHKGASRIERVTLDLEMVKEAQDFANIWLPHDNVVMDLALVNGELSVVEFNCINCSGLFEVDANVVFDALWNYYS